MTEIQDVWAVTDGLFEQFGDLNRRPIDLRHPFLFYMGHIPAFAWNRVQDHEQSPFDQLFAFGIDPKAPIAEQVFPPLNEVMAYRDKLRLRLLEALPEEELDLVIEHELMHQETLLYMAQAAGLVLTHDVETGDGVAARPIGIPAGEALLGTVAGQWGWDNEFPQTTRWVADFEIDSLPVRNKDWLAFVEADGPIPSSWCEGQVRSLAGLRALDEVLGWPVQVTGRQADAYARFLGRRLPTEWELARIRQGDDPYNAGGERLTPRPVGGGTGMEVVGNGWEWTSTLFAGLPGFQARHRGYEGYSADFFDGEHLVMVGSSQVTPTRLLRPGFRNWYRQDYPWVFSKFRTCAV